MTLSRRLLLACLIWPELAVHGCGVTRAALGAGCEQRFMAQPDDPEAARCFWLEAKQTGNRQEMAREVRKLLAAYPRNLGLQLYSAVLDPPLPDQGELVMRSVAAEYSHRDAVGEVLARDNLVNLLSRQGRSDEADREVQREIAAALALKMPTRSSYLALAEINRALLQSVRGDYRDASLSLDDVPPGPLRDERWLVVATRVHHETGQIARAWNDGIQLSQPIYSHFARAAGLYEQARTLAERAAELPAEVEASLIEQKAQAAIVEAEAGGNHRVAALAHHLLARLANGGGQARAELRRCLDEAAGTDVEGLCRGALARYQAKTGRAPAGEAKGELRGLELDDPVSRAQALGDQMRVSWKTRSLADFVRDAQRALSQIERLRAQQADPEIQAGLFSGWSDDYYWFSGRLLGANLEGRCPSCLDLAFEVVERLRARALRDIIVAASARDAAAGTDAERLVMLDQAIERVTKRRRESALPQGERENAASDLVALTAERDRLRRRASLPGAPGGDSTAAVSPGGQGALTAAFTTLSQVQALLEPEEALLSFQVGPWRDWTGDFGGGSWLVVATRTTRRCYRLGDMGREALRRAVADFFEHRRRSRPWQATELYGKLLAPALAALPPGIQRLIVVPDDHLHRLAFAALRASSDAGPIAARYQISIAPSATLWANWRAARRPKPAERPALVLADPPPPAAAAQRTFQADGIRLPSEPLPAARREADALVRSLGWGCERRVGGEASAAALLDSPLRLWRFALVHFAAHSIVDDRDPRRSGIWLSPSPGHDGLLRAAQIARLRFDDRLVVLSTCSSNGGPFLRGEGVLSLAHAFFQARARTVVASLWPQFDTDEEALFTAFYRYLGRGTSVAAALRLAQLDRLRQDPSLPPVAWAGMMVLGDGDLVPFPGGRHPWPRWWLVAAGWAAAAAVCALAARRVWGRRRRPQAVRQRPPAARSRKPGG
jgi:CHAT domain-containing protein